MKLDMRKKQEKKESTKVTKKLPMTAKMKRAMAVYIVMVLIMTACPVEQPRAVRPADPDVRYQ